MFQECDVTEANTIPSWKKSFNPTQPKTSTLNPSFKAFAQSSKKNEPIKKKNAKRYKHHEQKSAEKNKQKDQSHKDVILKLPSREYKYVRMFKIIKEIENMKRGMLKQFWKRIKISRNKKRNDKNEKFNRQVK